MIVRVNENPKIKDIEVVINCKERDKFILEIEKSLTYLNKVITGKIDGRNFTLTPNQIFYFDSIDNKVFAYTKDKVYDVNLKLYQLEDIFLKTPLIRINKNTILNTKKIKSFRSSFNGKMEAILKNNEAVIISRKYVPILREILGGKRK
ncbi:MAG: LytTR family transcriptional regulator DNA-binding domain-containing protein [Tenericutes bacterium]|nr:LytTR family transcriptional regulator DNA-binding domain-containing protein [Mycoplasmatota bacterium]